VEHVRHRQTFTSAKRLLHDRNCHLGLPSTIAQLGFILTSVAVNFLCRKFLIFKK
jgi:hypothetical protein